LRVCHNGFYHNRKCPVHQKVKGNLSSLAPPSCAYNANAVHRRWVKIVSRRLVDRFPRSLVEGNKPRNVKGTLPEWAILHWTSLLITACSSLISSMMSTESLEGSRVASCLVLGATVDGNVRTLVGRLLTRVYSTDLGKATISCLFAIFEACSIGECESS
jgi:hypothetical protein